MRQQLNRVERPLSSDGDLPHHERVVSAGVKAQVLGVDQALRRHARELGVA